MAVARDGETVGKRVSLLYQDLVSDTTAGGIEVDRMLSGEGFYRGVLSQVLGRLVLHVMIDGEDCLARIMDLGCTYSLEPRTTVQQEHRGRQLDVC